MQYRYAKKLHNRDEVEVCMKRPDIWAHGYVVGEPRHIEVNGRKVIEVIVATKEYGILYQIPHTALR